MTNTIDSFPIYSSKYLVDKFDEKFFNVFGKNVSIISDSTKISKISGECDFNGWSLDEIEYSLNRGNATTNVLECFAETLVESILATFLLEIDMFRKNEYQIVDINYHLNNSSDRQFIFNHLKKGGNINIYRLYHPHTDIVPTGLLDQSVIIKDIKGIIYDTTKVKIYNTQTLGEVYTSLNGKYGLNIEYLRWKDLIEHVKLHVPHVVEIDKDFIKLIK
jgi:hypothetical protein